MRLTGKLTLPVNTIIPDEGYWIRAQATDLLTGNSFSSVPTKLNLGNSDIPYSIYLPAGEYAVAYYFSSDTTPFIRMLYYSDSGMVETAAEATVITVGNFDVVGIDLALELKPIS